MQRAQERQAAEIADLKGDLRAIFETLRNLEKQNDRILERLDRTP